MNFNVFCKAIVTAVGVEIGKHLSLLFVSAFDINAKSKIVVECAPFIDSSRDTTSRLSRSNVYFLCFIYFPHSLKLNSNTGIETIVAIASQIVVAVHADRSRCAFDWHVGLPRLFRRIRMPRHHSRYGSQSVVSILLCVVD